MNCFIISLIHFIPICELTISALLTKIDTFANSVDPDQTAHNELSCCWQQLSCPDESVYVRTTGLKGLNIAFVLAQNG